MSILGNQTSICGTTGTTQRVITSFTASINQKSIVVNLWIMYYLGQQDTNEIMLELPVQSMFLCLYTILDMILFALFVTSLCFNLTLHAFNVICPIFLPHKLCNHLLLPYWWFQLYDQLGEALGNTHLALLFCKC